MMMTSVGKSAIKTNLLWRLWGCLHKTSGVNLGKEYNYSVFLFISYFQYFFLKFHDTFYVNSVFHVIMVKFLHRILTRLFFKKSKMNKKSKIFLIRWTDFFSFLYCKLLMDFHSRKFNQWNQTLKALQIRWNNATIVHHACQHSHVTNKSFRLKVVGFQLTLCLGPKFGNLAAYPVSLLGSR